MFSITWSNKRRSLFFAQVCERSQNICDTTHPERCERSQKQFRAYQRSEVCIASSYLYSMGRPAETPSTNCELFANKIPMEEAVMTTHEDRANEGKPQPGGMLSRRTFLRAVGPRPEPRSWLPVVGRLRRSACTCRVCMLPHPCPMSCWRLHGLMAPVRCAPSRV
jgi:hypothetical protein